MSEKRAKVDEKKMSRKNSERILDFVAKIACLVIAFFIWFYAMSTDVVTLEREFTVPVIFENETELFEKTGWSVLSGKDNSIVVTLKGKRNIMNQVTESDIYAFADVSGVESAGMQMIDIKISAPTECEIVNTSSSNISPYIDKRVTRNVPIKVVHTYEITSGYQLDDPITNIDEVSVTGPESELHKISAAQAELALGKITETVNTRSSLVLVDELGNPFISKYVSMATKNVNITVKLYAIKDVPLTVGYKYGYFNENNSRVTVTPNVITLRGEPSVLENMNELEIAVLDEKKFVKNSTQSVLINIPEGVKALSGENTATVNVEHINTDVKHITVNNITLANSGGLECELQTESLNIMLRGPHALLSQVKEENITLTADMKNYSSGSGVMVVPVLVKLSPEFEGSVYELETYNVTVNVK